MGPLYGVARLQALLALAVVQHAQAEPILSILFFFRGQKTIGL